MLRMRPRALRSASLRFVRGRPQGLRAAAAVVLVCAMSAGPLEGGPGPAAPAPGAPGVNFGGGEASVWRSTYAQQLATFAQVKAAGSQWVRWTVPMLSLIHISAKHLRTHGPAQHLKAPDFSKTPAWAVVIAGTGVAVTLVGATTGQFHTTIKPNQSAVPQKSTSNSAVRQLLNATNSASAVSYTHLDVYKRQTRHRWQPTHQAAPRAAPSPAVHICWCPPAAYARSRRI